MKDYIKKKVDENDMLPTKKYRTLAISEVTKKYRLLSENERQQRRRQGRRRGQEIIWKVILY